MKIMPIHIPDNRTFTNSIQKSATSSSQFINIFNKEISEQSTYSIQNELENKYNANLHVGSCNYAMNFTDMNSLNNVIISDETLEKMQKDKKFKDKILKIINDNCSPEAQKELRCLTPPVKSAGVVIYSDGTYVCWVESAYSKNDTDENKGEKGIEDPFMTPFDQIGNQISNQYSNFFNVIERQAMGYMKRKKNQEN